jgi:hypothetical protein
MEISPILGVPAVTKVKPDRLSPDLSRVFEAEYLGGAIDDSYDGDDLLPNSDSATDSDDPVVEVPEDGEAVDELVESGNRIEAKASARRVDFFA